MSRFEPSNFLKLASISGKILYADDFVGTDAQKLQAAFNAASSSNAEIIITRMFNITGSTITVSNGSNGMEKNIKLTGLNGGITKNDAGFVFTASASNGRFKVQNVLFVSTAGAGTSVFNMDELYEVVGSNNQYINVDHVALGTGNTQQSPRFLNENIQGGSGYAFDFLNLYDCTIDECIAEQRENFFIQRSQVPTTGNPAPGGYGANCLRITNCLIEGMTGTGAVIKAGFNSVCIITGNYFEGNTGADIDVSQNPSYSLTLSNNFIDNTNTAKTCILLPSFPIGAAGQFDRYVTMSNMVRGGANMFGFQSQPDATINILSINDRCVNGTLITNYASNFDVYGTYTETKSTTTQTTTYTVKNGVKRYRMSWTDAGINATSNKACVVDVGYSVSSNALISININHTNDSGGLAAPVTSQFAITNVVINGTDTTKLNFTVVNDTSAFRQTYYDITIIDY